MELPDWQTSSAGAKVRVALWLATEVGNGGAFRKAQLRAAFPNIEQVDRRMRDLRPEGWEILTYQEDRSLQHDELRLKSVGGRVWEPDYRSKVQTGISDKARQAAFLADNYQCIMCGVAGGEPYPDQPRRVAKLTAARLEGGTGARTVCDRCGSGRPVSVAGTDLERAVQDLSRAQRADLARWLVTGRRERTSEENLWLLTMRQPAEVRANVLALVQ